jgi:hypothetical protein
MATVAARVAASLRAPRESEHRASAAAATRNSPSIPTLRMGPLAGLSRRYIALNKCAKVRLTVSGSVRPFSVISGWSR